MLICSLPNISNNNTAEDDWPYISIYLYVTLQLYEQYHEVTYVVQNVAILSSLILQYLKTFVSQILVLLAKYATGITWIQDTSVTIVNQRMKHKNQLVRNVYIQVHTLLMQKSEKFTVSLGVKTISLEKSKILLLKSEFSLDRKQGKCDDSEPTTGT